MTRKKYVVLLVGLLFFVSLHTMDFLNYFDDYASPSTEALSQEAEQLSAVKARKNSTTSYDSPAFNTRSNFSTRTFESASTVDHSTDRNSKTNDKSSNESPITASTDVDSGLFSCPLETSSTSDVYTDSPASNTRSTVGSGDRLKRGLDMSGIKVDVRGGFSPASIGGPGPKEKKKKTTLRKHSQSKLDYNKVEEEIRLYEKCCVEKCFTWFTVALVIYCRNQYVGLPFYEDRRSWLHREMDEMGMGPSFPNYSIDILGQQRRKACAKAWRFCYGVQESWQARNMPDKYRKKTGKATINPKKIKLSKLNSRIDYFTQWLLLFANKVGCQMPFGDCGDQTEVRLPSPNKQNVYNFYCNHLELDVTSLTKPLHYDQFVKAWKSSKELKHIKCSKYKPGFSQCDACSDYLNLTSHKQLTAAQKSAEGLKFLAHIEQERDERRQYYRARAKAVEEPDKYMCIIMDAMDQRKTEIPFFTNAPKAVANDYRLRTKLIGAIAHGFGTFLYWCTNLICHDTNLQIECLRRTLLKYEAEKGQLPPILYLQLDNAPDNKSKQFLAFCAYLVEMEIFDCVKVSYLMVGHTHENIDSYFSCISRFIKRVKKIILTIGSFLEALLQCFKTPGCIPKCTEEIHGVYDTTPLIKFVDPDLARFALPEKTGDNVHHFIFRRNEIGKATLQYKIYRASVALYPREWVRSIPGSDGQHYHSEKHGVGTILRMTPERDMHSKKKFWRLEVEFQNENGPHIVEIIEVPSSILVFPGVPPKQLPTVFTVAPFAKDHTTVMQEQKTGIDATFLKLGLEKEGHEWDSFFNNLPANPNEVPIEQFSLPKPRSSAAPVAMHKMALPIDKGVRKVDIVTHAKFKNSERVKQVKRASALSCPLKQGNFVLLDIQLEDNPSGYNLPWFLGEIVDDVSHLPEDPAASFLVQVYRPSTLTNMYSKFVPWIGTDNKKWRLQVSRCNVFPVEVELQVRGKKLTAKSLKNIDCHEFLPLPNLKEC